MNLSQVPYDLAADDLVKVTLVSSGSLAAIAAPQLARHFDLSQTRATALLADGRGVVASRVARQRAKAALQLMATLGVHLKILNLEEAPAPELFDVSVRLAGPTAVSAVAKKLRDLGYVDGAGLSDFHGPRGLEICNLTGDRVEELARVIGTCPGVDVLSSDQTGARYDIFVGASMNRPGMAQILKHLADIGCHADTTLPALAAGLDRPMLANFNARFPDHGLICVNQKFQLYDLTLTGLGEVSIRDFTDFLTTRGHAPSIAFDALASQRRLRIDTALSRATACQFLSDYAMIGLQVRADFVHLPEKTIKMSLVKPGFMPIR